MVEGCRFKVEGNVDQNPIICCFFFLRNIHGLAELDPPSLTNIQICNPGAGGTIHRLTAATSQIQPIRLNVAAPVRAWKTMKK